MSDIVVIATEEPFKNVGTADEPRYVAAHVAKALGFNAITFNKHCGKLFVKYNSDELVKNYKFLSIDKHNSYRRRTGNVFTLNGLKRFLLERCSRCSHQILNYYNIPIYGNIVVVETEWIANIKETFGSEIIMIQYKVGSYRLDAYFPDHNIAAELLRTEFVNKELEDPTWIRFDPYKKNIFKILGVIYDKLKLSLPK